MFELGELIGIFIVNVVKFFLFIGKKGYRIGYDSTLKLWTNVKNKHEEKKTTRGV